MPTGGTCVAWSGAAPLDLQYQGHRLEHNPHPVETRRDCQRTFFPSSPNHYASSERPGHPSLSRGVGMWLRGEVNPDGKKDKRTGVPPGIWPLRWPSNNEEVLKMYDSKPVGNDAPKGGPVDDDLQNSAVITPLHPGIMNSSRGNIVVLDPVKVDVRVASVDSQWEPPPPPSLARRSPPAAAPQRVPRRRPAVKVPGVALHAAFPRPKTPFGEDSRTRRSSTCPPACDARTRPPAHDACLARPPPLARSTALHPPDRHARTRLHARTPARMPARPPADPPADPLACASACTRTLARTRTPARKPHARNARLHARLQLPPASRKLASRTPARPHARAPRARPQATHAHTPACPALDAHAPRRQCAPSAPPSLHTHPSPSAPPHPRLQHVRRPTLDLRTCTLNMRTLLTLDVRDPRDRCVPWLHARPALLTRRASTWAGRVYAARGIKNTWEWAGAR
ncbi:hypothetical protein OF83DRAFT_1087826, partial [Amylostereum chailletii]